MLSQSVSLFTCIVSLTVQSHVCRDLFIHNNNINNNTMYHMIKTHKVAIIIV